MNPLSPLYTRNRFSIHRNILKMQAYKLTALSQFGQNKYEEALEYQEKALKFAKAVLENDDAELGDLYLRSGVIYTKLDKLKKAQDSFKKAGKTFQRAYDKEDPLSKEQSLAQLKETLGYQIRVAETFGDNREIASLKKRLEDLP